MALPGANPTVQIAITYSPTTGLAISNIGSDLNKVASTVEDANRRLARSVETSVATLARTGINTGIAAFTAFTAAVTGGVFALERIGKAFISVNENFANLEIGLKSALRSVEAARKIRDEVANITAVSFIPFQGLAGISRFMATTPTLRVQLEQSVQQGTLGDAQAPLRRMVTLMEQMQVFRPDRDVQDAIFSIRAMMAGNMQSLIRRFSLPPQLLPAYAPPEANVRDLKDLKARPEVALAALRNLMDSIITPESVNEFIRQPKILMQNFFEQLFEIPALRLGDTGFYNKILDYFYNIYQKTTTFINSGFQKYVDQIGTNLGKMFDTFTHYGERFAESLLKLAGFGKIDFPNLSFADRLMKAISATLDYAATALPGFLDKLLNTFDTVAKVVGQVSSAFTSLISLFTESFNASPWMTVVGALTALRLLPNVLAQTFGVIQRGVASLIGGTSAASLATGAASNFAMNGTPSIFNSSALRGAPRDIQQYLEFRTPGTGSGLTAPAYYLTSDAPEEFFAVAGKNRPAGNALTQIRASTAEKIFGNQVSSAATTGANVAAGGMFTGLISGITAAVAAFALVTLAIGAVVVAMKAFGDEQERRNKRIASQGQDLLSGRTQIFTGIDQDQYTGWNPFTADENPRSSSTGRLKKGPLWKFLPESFQDQTTFSLREPVDAVESRLNTFEDFFKRVDELRERHPEKFSPDSTSFLKESASQVVTWLSDLQVASDYLKSGSIEKNVALPSGGVINNTQDALRVINDESTQTGKFQSAVAAFVDKVAQQTGEVVPIIEKGSAEAQKQLQGLVNLHPSEFMGDFRDPQIGGAIRNRIQQLDDLRKTASYTSELDVTLKKFDSLTNPIGAQSRTGSEIVARLKDILSDTFNEFDAAAEVIKTTHKSLGEIETAQAKLEAVYKNAPDTTPTTGTEFDTEEFRKQGVTTIGQVRKNLEENRKRLSDALTFTNTYVSDEARKLMDAHMLSVTAVFGDAFANLTNMLETTIATSLKGKISSASPIAREEATSLQAYVQKIVQVNGLAMDVPSTDEFANALFAPPGSTPAQKAIHQEDAAKWLESHILQPFIDAITEQKGDAQAAAPFVNVLRTLIGGMIRETAAAGKDAAESELERFRTFMRTRAESFVAGMSSNLLGGGPNANSIALQRFGEAQRMIPGLQGVGINAAPFLTNTTFMGDAATDVQIDRLKALVDFNAQLTKRFQEQTLSLRDNSPERQKLIGDMDKLRSETAAYLDQLSTLQTPGLLPSFFQGLNQALSISRNNLNSLRDEGKELGDALKTSLGTAFYDFISGAKNAGDAFKEFGSSILQTAAKIAAQKAANALLGILFNVLGSVVGGALGGTTGSYLGGSIVNGAWQAAAGSPSGISDVSSPGSSIDLSGGGSIDTGGVYNSGGGLNVDLPPEPPGGATGGRLRGGSGMRDDILFRGMSDEFLLNQRASRAIGFDTLHDLNKGRVSVAKAGSGPTIQFDQGNPAYGGGRFVFSPGVFPSPSPSPSPSPFGGSATGGGNFDNPSFPTGPSVFVPTFGAATGFVPYVGSFGFSPVSGETWMGGGFAGIDPATGAPVYNPQGYGSNNWGQGGQLGGGISEADVAAQSAMFQGHHMQRGGAVRGGSKIRDDILILGMDGEFMLRKEAAAYYGPKWLDDANNMRLKKYAQGGYVGSTPARSSESGGNVIIPINITVPVGNTPQDTQKRQELGKQLAPMFEAACQDVIAREIDPGGKIYNAMRQ